ncbi:MAG: TRAP transporter small permease subunit [Rhizobiaceae bacterium]
MNSTTATMDDVNVDDTLELHELTADDMPLALRVSEKLRAFVDWMGRFGSWFAVALILITVFDLAIRKTGRFQIWLVENVGPIFNSTILQELEWHSHTVLFSLVLAYGVIWNTHVRVDLVRENLKFRTKAWLEFIGLTFFFIPYLCVLLYFATIYAYDSYQIGEISASLVGLPHRWIIKTVLATGIFMTIISGIAVWLQMAIVLFGPKQNRFPLMTVEWPESGNTMIEGKERLNMDKAVDALAERAKLQAAKTASAAAASKE